MVLTALLLTDAVVAGGAFWLAYAVRFPLLLLVVFGAIALWFRMRGGYKPIELVAHESSKPKP